MSYILEALKKAEAERERGAIPGLTTDQSSNSVYMSLANHHKPRWLLLVPLVLLVLAWLVWSVRAPGTISESTALPTSRTASVAVPEPAREPQAVLAQASSAAPLLVQSKVMPVVVNAHSPPPATPTAKPVPTTPMIAATAAPEPAAKPATLGSVHSASGGIPTLAELPETVRRQIPNINISGAVNSDSPADGALIINDQVMGKGGQVAPELRLEEVNANSAVFNFKGQRFRIDR